ncbi:MAG: RagB/SusD family nutrient uptake outer membrane protein [Bacteroidaceae bacterium]|nr:RagB/SusD family nutrient uptake outer membrane protein [Bacteroidaceae bacterium]
MKKFQYVTSLVLAGALSFTACVDADIDDALEYDEHYSTVSDADNAVLGVYSSFFQLAGQMVVLNELRGDLMDLTTNSSIALQEVDAVNPSKDNIYTDPTPYYNVINNCNDVLANFEKMYKENSLTETQFLERYSDVMALRSYVYLNLVAQFGKVPYISEPVVSVEDLKNSPNMLDIDGMVDQLIADMTSTTVTGDKILLEPYSEASLVQNTLDGYNLGLFFINKKFLMGDLYLWDGQYLEAALQYKSLMDYNNDADATQNNLYYKCTGQDTWTTASNYKDHHQIFFLRYQEDNTVAFNNQWVDMFSSVVTERRIPYEWVWTPTFDAAYEPVYPFIDLFATTADGGSYQLKPSDYVVDSLWNNQVMKNGFPYDARGVDCSYSESPEGNVVAKYLYHYDPLVPYEKEGRLFLYRAGLLHLRYCEAINRLGQPHLAAALLNQGVGYSQNSYTRTEGYLIIGSEETPVQGGLTGEPFYFATSQTAANTIYGYRREPWRTSRGIRGRAALNNQDVSAFVDKKLSECTTLGDSMLVMEHIIIDELALECAFEGNRFPDLVRVAHRMNVERMLREDMTLTPMSGDDYMEAVMQGKYELNGRTNPYVGGEENWFLPLE